MWDGELNDIIATRCNGLSSGKFWFLNKQAFMTHSFIVVTELRFPPVEAQINNQAHPLNVPPLPFCSWQAFHRGSAWFVLAREERAKCSSFFNMDLCIVFIFLA